VICVTNVLLRFAHQCIESRLPEIFIICERINYAALTHDDKRYAICHAPRFIFMSSIQLERALEQRTIQIYYLYFAGSEEIFNYLRRLCLKTPRQSVADFKEHSIRRNQWVSIKQVR